MNCAVRILALGLFIATSNQAAAQDNIGKDSAGEGGLSTIIVTAQKRQENQQDVPIAITTLTDSFLTSNSVNSLEDLASTVPGFITTHSVNYGAAPLAIRGVGGANGGGNFFADEPVAVYIDEVYVGRLSISTAAL
ncbi:MAG: TonB-dependent receptor plug domain-containing protein, partial [Parasphingorhabdus sp.]